MYHFSEGGLLGEVCRLRSNQAHETWFWYRDVLRQAEELGHIRIMGHSEEQPFWWRWFDESVEIISDRLRQTIAEEAASADVQP